MDDVRRRFEAYVDRSGEHHLWTGAVDAARGTGRFNRRASRFELTGTCQTSVRKVSTIAPAPVSRRSVFPERSPMLRMTASDTLKLYRADPQDREDLVTLWPRCNFASPDHAVAAFRDAYPHAPADDQLANFIRDIARDAR
jgi:hypothetical protein